MTMQWNNKLALAGSLSLALIAVPVLPQEQSQEQSQEQEMASVAYPSPAFIGHYRSQLPAGINARTMVSVSDVLFDNNGSAVRVVVCATTYSRGHVILSQAQCLRTLSTGSSEFIDMAAGPFDPGLSKALAVEHLGESNPLVLQDYVDAEPMTPPLVVRIRLQDGMLWGTVLSSQDLVIEIDSVP